MVAVRAQEAVFRHGVDPMVRLQAASASRVRSYRRNRDRLSNLCVSHGSPHIRLPRRYRTGHPSAKLAHRWPGRRRRTREAQRCVLAGSGLHRPGDDGNETLRYGKSPTALREERFGPAVHRTESLPGPAADVTGPSIPMSPGSGGRLVFAVPLVHWSRRVVDYLRRLHRRGSLPRCPSGATGRGFFHEYVG
jgi:hypothetical protein